MIKENATSRRKPRSVDYQADLVVVGGGLSGTCCAITAARAGIKVILVQDRPVLGGNASSEVRLWVLGATSHMGNNNRWAREGGVIDELLLENLYRNPEGNALIFDSILLEKVISEPNIRLLLNTAVYDLEKEGDSIKLVKGFCSQNSTHYQLTAPLFCDASGDGIVAFQAGAAFRMGAESGEEFGEKFAPTAEYGELLGHSLYFYSKDVGKPVRYIAPSFAHDVTQKVPKFKSFNAKDFGCRLWWVEYGGRLDTVHDTEQIKWELWKVIYGVWNYIKNSGQFPEAENLTLEWVGMIPGKRESRRFEGDYMLIQQDIVEQRTHYDAVAFGGWSIDLHPADGVFSEKPGCNQWHSKGIYQIPYRCMYSRNVDNLFVAGRIISASHVAFGSSRVMATSAHVGQAVGMAAQLCTQKQCNPRVLSETQNITALQKALLKTGQHIPNLTLKDEEDLVQEALLQASSELIINELIPDGPLLPLSHSAAQMLPLRVGAVPQLTVWALADQDTTLTVEFRKSSKPHNHTPDVVLVTQKITLHKGKQEILLDFGVSMTEAAYGFVCFLKNERVALQYSQTRITGILSVFNKTNPAVSNYGKQEPTEDIGVEAFEFWTPERRPKGHNIAMKIAGGIQLFSAENLKNGLQRPTYQPNAWVADTQDANPTLTIQWNEKKAISTVELFFDTDFDHPLESVLLTHPETVSPFCVQDFIICNDRKERIFEKTGNYLSRQTIHFEQPLNTQSLSIHLKAPHEHVPAALMEVRCYEC
jgi:hypothetical protein